MGHVLAPFSQSDACSYPHTDWFNLVVAAEELMIWVLQYFDCDKKLYCRSHIADFPHTLRVQQQTSVPSVMALFAKCMTHRRDRKVETFTGSNMEETEMG